MKITPHIIAGILCLQDTKRCKYIDENNITWKWVENRFIGKRTVISANDKYCWLEETDKKTVKKWLCGINANYDEIFIK